METDTKLALDIEEAPRIRRASARVETAGRIRLRLPRHWSKAAKQSAIDELVNRIHQKQHKQARLLEQAAAQPSVTITSDTGLAEFVGRINAESFNVPLAKIRIGRSKYNHLAQVNLKTKTMTVSCYCLYKAPAEALRYLIIHELAHYLESGHNKRFWSLVEKHVPDYRLQSRIIKAFHHQATLEPEQQPDEAQDTRVPQQPPAATVQTPPSQSSSILQKTGPAAGKPGFINQLKFWERQ